MKTRTNQPVTTYDLEELEVKDLGVSGDAKLFENIVDKDGHPRFVEGNIEIGDYFAESITPVYCRWSLSGSHLMVVVCGIVSANTEMTAHKGLTKLINVPQWVLDKICPIVGNVVTTGSCTMWASNYQNVNLQYNVIKGGASSLLVNVGTTVTPTLDMQFRIQFDLVIDNE